MEIIQISMAAARVNADLSQKEAAEKLGVTPVTLGRWEKGEAIPNMAVARKMAELYGIPLDYIRLPST